MRVICALLVLLGLTGIALADGARVETGYRRGKKFKIKVVSIGWADVEVATAKAYRQMEAAAADAGIELGIRSGFRSHARQRWLYRAFRAGHGNPAERPGYSNHQDGRALDLVIYDEATYAWLTAHARRFGFTQTVREEPWHWVYTPRKGGARGARGDRARRTATR